MRTVIFGVKGQLGRELYARFSEGGEVVGVDLPEVDITDARQVAEVLAKVQPELVLNAAAYTDVERAESEPAQAFEVNEAGARHIAQAAENVGATVVYYSTDYVFGGTQQQPYRPEDATAPLAVYGRSKWAGEQATRSESTRAFVLRTAWLYGPGGNNFVEKILRAAQQRSELRVVEDEVGSPTHTWDLAEATWDLVQTQAYGTYHAVNAGACSRFAWAQAIVAAAKLSTAVHPCAASEFPTQVERPAYSVLDTSSLTAACGYRMRPWQEALAMYMERRGAV